MPTDAYRDDELLRRWISGELTAPEEAELERRATRDPDLREALDGLSSAPETDHGARVAAMVERVRPTAAVRRIPYARYAAAATGLVLLAVAVLLLPRYFGESESTLAMTEAQEIEPTPPAPAPASPAPASAPREQQDVAPPPQENAPAPAAPAATRSKRVPVQDEQPEVESAVEETEADAMARSSAVPPPPPAPVLQSAPPPAVRRRMAPPPVSPRQVTGRVTDANGTPLPDIEVRRAGQPLGVTTDSNGIFTLPYDLTLNLLRLSHSGFEDETVEVFDTTASLQISLEAEPVRQPADFPETAAISRVDLNDTPLERAVARPVEGYRALRRRIEEEKPDNVPAGKVRVSFLVDDDGNLSDFRFRGQPDGATMDYVGKTLVESSTWEVVTGEAPVRVYFTLRFE
ncbi:carboxypeptidase regulatory-like domain-containing protein [Lewinella sp. IMCC34183]|uniref:carboxypeptidase regulatory-like domain-containing protein n=1 Tax=Lewinella sp. IMCC34183 TaxID=2248762 RepID=UPI000E2644EE|nr:carboxypeptidase regulatory-like domain-containing protein [Lewinella sp. IMCC34183]